jgi:hypothetical protein
MSNEKDDPRAADKTPAAEDYALPRGIDPLTRERFAEFQGRDPHPSGREMCYHIKQPSFPQYRFEWHPKSRKVYLIRLGITPLVGEILAEHAETHGAAIAFVQTFLRGFREGAAPTIRKTHLEG